jgi:hypothetical protein
MDDRPVRYKNQVRENGSSVLPFSSSSPRTTTNVPVVQAFRVPSLEIDPVAALAEQDHRIRQLEQQLAALQGRGGYQHDPEPENNEERPSPSEQEEAERRQLTIDLEQELRDRSFLGPDDYNYQEPQLTIDLEQELRDRSFLGPDDYQQPQGATAPVAGRSWHVLDEEAVDESRRRATRGVATPPAATNQQGGRSKETAAGGADVVGGGCGSGVCGFVMVVAFLLGATTIGILLANRFFGTY